MVGDTLRSIEDSYAPDEDRPLGSFLGLMSAYGASTATAAALLHRSGVELPEHVPVADLALLTVATHKLARLLAKDPITSPVRAPFTRFAGTSADAELHEEVRGHGPRKAVGELVTCPFCLAQWVATGLLLGYVAKPKPTRMAALLFTIVSGSDVLQHLYARLQSGD